MAETDDAVDRISELPPFIVHHIMSYLSAEAVAQTSVLSKKWYHLRTTFPILDFDQTSFIRIGFHPNTFLFWRTQKSFCVEVKNFLRFVDVSVDRFYEQKIRMHKFRLFISLLKVRKLSSFVDKWICLAVTSGVKELDINVITDKQRMYTLPQTFFSAKLVTALKLGYCKLDVPLETIVRFHSLRKLTLEEVCINEQTVQKLTSGCPLLEDLFFNQCWGLKSYCIYEACNLEFLEIDLSFHHKDVERFEIVVPSLQKFSLLSAFYKTPLLIEVAGCTNLKILDLSALRFKDQYFHSLISKFPSLEELSVGSCPSLETVIISSIRLKKLCLVYCENLKALEVDAPNLLSFTLDNPIPRGSLKAPCPWEVIFWNNGAVGTSWYLDMKEFLRQCNHIEVLSLNVCSAKISFNLDEFRERSPSLPFEVEKLCVCVRNEPPSSVSALFDGIFAICYFRTLSLRTDNKAVCSKFIEWVYEELKNGDASCCNSHSVKCWRHYLKAVNIEISASANGQKPPDIYNLMDAWPVHLKGTLQCQLGWCLDRYTGYIS